MKLRAAILGVALAGAAFGQSELGRQQKKVYVTVGAAPTVSLEAGRGTIVKVGFRVNAGYHVNSNRPGSPLLIPTTLEFTPLEKIKAGRTVYPPGRPLALEFSPNEKLNVYTGDVMTDVPVNVAKGAKPGQYTLQGVLHYQACDERSCYPPKDLPVEIAVEVKAARPR